MKKLALCVAMAAAMVAPMAVWAEQPPLIDRKLFFGEVEISGAQISPDGQWLSFLKPYKGTRNIWVKKAGEPFSAAKPMSGEATRPVRGYFWSRDSKYLLYAQDAAGDENFNVYAIDPAAAADAEDGAAADAGADEFEGRADADLRRAEGEAGCVVYRVERSRSAVA